MLSILKQPLTKALPLAISLSLIFFPQVLKVNAMPLNQTEIDQKIQAIPQWQQQQQNIVRVFKFKNFVEAVAFVNQLVEPAEAAGHHPDITIEYNQVTISLTTHDAGGLTQMDFDLAQTISALTD